MNTNSQIEPAGEMDGISLVEFRYQNGTYRSPSLIGGRFRVTGILAAGGFGMIFQATDLALFNKKVLIKTSRYPAILFRHQKDRNRQSAIEKCRFRMSYERKMLLQASRREISGVPVILDYCTEPGPDLYGPHTDETGGTFACTDTDQAGVPLWRTEPFLVLSYVDGTPLNDVISQPWFYKNCLGHAKQVILQIGRILTAFHRETLLQDRKVSFVYQDLKPANILYTRERQFVLIDFGGFAMRADGKTLSNFAKTGTPGYQPPEFVNYAYSPERIDATADVFSLGAVVYTVLAGVPPLATPTGEAVFDPEKLKTFPDPWRAWVEKATAPDPRNRYASMKIAIDGSHSLPLGQG